QRGRDGVDVSLIERRDVVGRGWLRGQLGDPELRFVRAVEWLVVLDERLERRQLRRGAADAGGDVNIAVRAERPEPILHDRRADGDVDLPLVDRAARASGIIRSAPATRLRRKGDR